MFRNTNTDMQKVEKGSISQVPEQTYPGPIFTPAVDIYETSDKITLLADMPGLAAKDLKIDLRENVLTLSGRVTAPESQKESSVLCEYGPGSYFRQFTLSEMIDQAKIDAKLTDGVLELDLPKLERAKPRQITVKSS